MGDLNDNFSTHTIQCRGVNCCGHSSPISPLLIEALQAIQQLFGVPIHITRGFSCNVHNREVGGVEGSRHTKGDGADCLWLDEVSNERVIAYITNLYAVGALILYDTHFHLDMRSRVDGKMLIIDNRTIN